jgi:hypothetical protein
MLVPNGTSRHAVGADAANGHSRAVSMAGSRVLRETHVMRKLHRFLIASRNHPPMPYAESKPSFGPSLTLAAAVLALAACASPPDVAVDPGSDPNAARVLLAEAAAEGPVLVTWRGEPPLPTPQFLHAVERGATGIGFDATAEGDASRRFIFDFTGGSRSLCGDPTEDRSALRPYLVKAAFCDGERAVAMAATDPTGDPERLIWRLTGRLVPDNYPQTYGFNVFGGNFGVGLGTTFGF